MGLHSVPVGHQANLSWLLYGMQLSRGYFLHLCTPPCPHLQNRNASSSCFKGMGLNGVRP